MHWLDALALCRRQRQPCVLLTVLHARGHAPRDAGAKMVFSLERSWGSIGGGNLEETALKHARMLVNAGGTQPETFTIRLSDKAEVEFGVQCCGGEVSVLCEPMPVAPAVAICGMGHVGLELATILVRHPLEVHLIDSRLGMLGSERLAPLEQGNASVHTHHAPVPESVLAALPEATHLLIMTHDHAEDLALCDSALRHDHLASIGLIGSQAKWKRFQKQLLAQGHSAEDLSRINTPIGIPGLRSKEPAVIAVSVAASLLLSFEKRQP